MDNKSGIHIGKIIRTKLKEQGRSVTWLAQQIPCSRNHMYKIFNNSSINTDLLLRITKVMDYNFFQHFQ